MATSAFRSPIHNPFGSRIANDASEQPRRRSRGAYAHPLLPSQTSPARSPLNPHSPYLQSRRRGSHELGEDTSNKLHFSLYVSSGERNSQTICIQGKGDLSYGSSKTPARSTLNPAQLRENVLAIVRMLSKDGLSLTAHFDSGAKVESSQVMSPPSLDARSDISTPTTPVFLEEHQGYSRSRRSFVNPAPIDEEEKDTSTDLPAPSLHVPHSNSNHSLESPSSVVSNLSGGDKTPQSPQPQWWDADRPRSSRDMQLPPLRVSNTPRHRDVRRSMSQPQETFERFDNDRRRKKVGHRRQSVTMARQKGRHSRGVSEDSSVAQPSGSGSPEAEVYSVEFECRRVMMANLDLEEAAHGVGARVVAVRKGYPVFRGSIIVSIDGENVENLKFRSIKSKLKQGALRSRPVDVTFIHDPTYTVSPPRRSRRRSTSSLERRNTVRQRRQSAPPPESPRGKGRPSVTSTPTRQRQGSRDISRTNTPKARVQSADAYNHRRSKNITNEVDTQMRQRIEAEIIEQESTTSFADIHGVMDVKLALYWVFRLLEEREEDEYLSRSKLLHAPNGILLFGPPGNGKTMVAKCLSYHFPDWTFFNISASSILSKYVGEAERCMRTLFTMAQERKPSIIFIDEIDCLLTCRKENEHDQSRRVKTEFLSRFNSDSNDGVVVIGATNLPGQLDEAVLRRFKCRIMVSLPQFEGRYGYLRTVMQHEYHALDEQAFQEIAKKTEGFSYCDLEQLCSSAALGAYAEATQRADSVPISVSHIYSSLETTHPSVNPETVHACEKWSTEHASSVPTGVLQTITLPDDWLPRQFYGGY